MLVAFEGIDGSGKSTAIRSVARRLRSTGRRVVVTREPTSTWLGREVRNGIRSRMDPLRLAGLFLADRAAHVASLRPRLENGTVVLTDRYADSTTAYQAVTLRGKVPLPLETLRDVQARIFPSPEFVFLFDMDPRASLARIHRRSVREPFEKIRFLAQVRKNYLALSRREPRRWRVLDATEPKEEIVSRIVRTLQRRLAEG